MKLTYSNPRELLYLLPFALLILFFACEEDFPEGPENEDTGAVAPSIDTARAVYNDLTQQFFLEASISDPQGIPNLDTITFKAFNPQLISPSIIDGLNDLGLHGDIIRGDGRYSRSLPSSFTKNQLGTFRFEIMALDVDGNVSEVFKLEFNTNSPPEIFLVSVTSEVVAGDTISIEVGAEDPNGLADIRKITYNVRDPEGNTIIDPSFVFRDDGKFGDRKAGDAVYSVKQPTNADGSTGVFTFVITAEDFSGLKSDELLIPVTLTDPI